MAERKLIVKIIGDSRSVEKALKRAAKSSDGFSGKMRGMGKSVAKGFAVAGVAAAGFAVAIGIKSVQAAAAFEKSMSRVVGLAGQSQKQVAKWSDKLIGLGPALAKSPQELAEALYFIASSGIPASKAISALTASAKASTAGLGETAVVADAVTSVMNAYASSGMTATRATDALVAMVREGKGEADAFAGVIGNVAAFASRLKVPIEQVGAALASMTQLGTDPATAATQLSAFFSSVLKVSSKTQKKADEIGFSFENLTSILASGNLRGALKYIKDFAIGHGGIQSLALMFPNIRALRALLALTADDGGKVERVFGRMADSRGSLNTAFAAASNTSSVNIDRFKAAIDALKIAFGQGLLPAVNEVAIALGKKLMDPKFVQRVRDLGRVIGEKLIAAFRAISKWFDANWEGIKSGFRTGAAIARSMARAVERIHGGFMKLSKVSPGGAGSLIGLLLSGVLLVKARKLLKVLGAGGLGKGKGGKGAKGGIGWKNALRGGVVGIGLSGAGREVEGGSVTRINDLEGLLRLARLGKLSARALEVAGRNLTPMQMKRLRAAMRGGGGTHGKRPTMGGGFQPGRAQGGPVMPGVPYRIGERGPESVVFGSAGTVIPNGGGGITINGNVHLHGVQNPQQLLKQLQRKANSTAASRRGVYGGAAMNLG